MTALTADIIAVSVVRHGVLYITSPTASPAASASSIG